MTIGDVVSLLAALGLGAILGAYFKSRFEHRKEVEADIHKLKRDRYGAILIQMLTIIDPEKGIPKLKEHRPDLKNIEDIEDEIRTEMLNSILFANDDVITSMSDFLSKPTQDTYIKVTLAMRKDLWGKSTKINDTLLLKLTLNEISHEIKKFSINKS